MADNQYSDDCFFFQAEDGIRDGTVTGVQTCALPISGRVTLNPSVPWSFSVSYAYLASPEAQRPSVGMHRATAAALYGHALGATGQLAATQIGRASCRERVWGAGVGGAWKRT